MNGRIYDPRLGRFLQADPIVQAPKNSQSLNRYAYVLNNPFSYTDPSGYFIKELALFVAAVARVIYTWEDPSSWVYLAASAKNLVDAFGKQQSALPTGATVGAFTNGFSTATSVNTGGVQHGGVQETGSPSDRVIAATVGGTGSDQTGRKSTNGADTNSFAYSSNSEKHHAQRGLFGLAVGKVTEFGQSVVDEVAFGARAVVSGVSEDYQEGGVLGVIIGATGGPTDRSFFNQVHSDYVSTSLIIGPIANVNKKLTGLLFAGAVTKRYGGYTVGQLILKGPALHLGTYGASARLAAATTVVNSVVITASYEGGSYVGSLLRTTINRTARLFEEDR